MRHIRAGVFGAAGYSGLELARLLERHPAVEVVFAASASAAGESLARVVPGAPPWHVVEPEAAPLGDADVAFLCLPPETSGELAPRLRAAGARIIDLSAAFRLSSSNFRAWYGLPHPAPELLADAVYGLTEHARPRLPAAGVVANPGCYATSVLLALAPLVQAGAVAGTVVVDSKSGVSGAGRRPQLHTSFVEVADNVSPYAVGSRHRHLPEMTAQLERWRPGQAPALIFTPHLLPVPRGILSTIYVPLRPGWDPDAARDALQTAFGQEPFLLLLPPGEVATLAHVLRTNGCAVSVHPVPDADPPVVVLVSVIDNLVKGAAGQAVQNMNVMFSQPETMGLED